MVADGWMLRTSHSLLSKSTSCSSMHPCTHWKACMRFEKMVTFHCRRSCCEKPAVWMRRICLRTVDFPLSPAPRLTTLAWFVQSRSLGNKVHVFFLPSSSNLTSRAFFFSSSFICFSISAFLLASVLSPPFEELPKHMIVPKVMHRL